jgi:hypothetical protein
MAKGQQQVITQNDVATVVVPEVVKETALAVKQNTALAVADGADRNDRRGKENLDMERLVLPRIAAAQKTSPEIEEGDARQIPGLKMFQMFNSLTQEIYGNGPLKFAVVRSLPFKAMQFDKDLKVVDRDVKQGDARLEFTTDENGQRVRPVATEFKEYLVILEDGSVAGLSFKSTQISVSAKLDSFINFRPGASWLGMYKLTSARKDFPSGPATQFTVLPAGPTPAEIIDIAEGVYKMTSNKIIDVTPDTTGEGEKDDFANTDKVPF